MPYLQFVFCEKCENVNLDIDDRATIEEYILEGRKSAFINPATLVWDYLIYRCPLCKSQYKYTYKDIEMKTRNHFSDISSKYKKYFDDLSSYQQGEEERLNEKSQISNRTSQRLDSLYRNKKE